MDTPAERRLASLDARTRKKYRALMHARACYLAAPATAPETLAAVLEPHRYHVAALLQDVYDVNDAAPTMAIDALLRRWDAVAPVHTGRSRPALAPLATAALAVPVPVPKAAPVPVPKAAPVPVPKAAPVPVPVAAPVPVPVAAPVPVPVAAPVPMPMAAPAAAPSKQVIPATLAQAQAVLAPRNTPAAPSAPASTKLPPPAIAAAPQARPDAENARRAGEAVAPVAVVAPAKAAAVPAASASQAGSMPLKSERAASLLSSPAKAAGAVQSFSALKAPVGFVAPPPQARLPETNASSARAMAAQAEMPPAVAPQPQPEAAAARFPPRLSPEQFDALYKKLNVVGVQGATVQTWLAQDVRSGRKVAVRESALRPQDSDITLRLAQQEMAIMTRLQHPNIVAYHAAYLVGATTLCVVMQYVVGNPMPTVVPPPVGALAFRSYFWNAAAQLSDALNYMHMHGVAHRDVNPNKIIVTTNDGPRQLPKYYLADYSDTCLTDQDALAALAQQPVRADAQQVPFNDMTCLGVSGWLLSPELQALERAYQDGDPPVVVPPDVLKSGDVWALAQTLVRSFFVPAGENPMYDAAMAADPQAARDAWLDGNVPYEDIRAFLKQGLRQDYRQRATIAQMHEVAAVSDRAEAHAPPPRALPAPRMPDAMPRRAEVDPARLPVPASSPERRLRTIEDTFALPTLATGEQVAFAVAGQKLIPFLAKMINGGPAAAAAGDVACVLEGRGGYEEFAAGFHGAEFLRPDENGYFRRMNDNAPSTLPKQKLLNQASVVRIQPLRASMEALNERASDVPDDVRATFFTYTQPVTGRTRTFWMSVNPDLQRLILEQCPGGGTRKRFVLMVLLLQNENSSHATALLIDLKAHTLERFDPNGANSFMNNPLNDEVNWYEDVVAHYANHLITKILPALDLTYLPVDETCPRFGPQAKQRQTQAGGGYCAAWTVYLLLTRVLNPDLTTKQVQETVLDRYSAVKLYENIRRFTKWIDEVLGEDNDPKYNLTPKTTPFKEPANAAERALAALASSGLSASDRAFVQQALNVFRDEIDQHPKPEVAAALVQDMAEALSGRFDEHLAIRLVTPLALFALQQARTPWSALVLAAAAGVLAQADPNERRMKVLYMLMSAADKAQPHQRAHLVRDAARIMKDALAQPDAGYAAHVAVQQIENMPAAAAPAANGLDIGPRNRAMQALLADEPDLLLS